jgi:preprotein translocase subunit SecG
MTIGESLSRKPDDQLPPAPARRRPSTWVQIAIVLTSAIVLGGSSCAGMAASYANHQTLFTLATVGFAIGVVTIPITIVWAIVVLTLELVRKRGAGE